MNEAPLVSVIIIFFNAEDFLSEAIESVLKQTYTHWELLLADDGSTDGSRVIADSYAIAFPNQVRVLAHAGNENRGMAATRNLGIHHAKGKYVAFLDADDLWLEHKLAEQVPILEDHDEVGMLYGETLYWHSWSKDVEDGQRDYAPSLRVPFRTPILPPRLLPLFLRGKAAVPCPCSVLARRSLLTAVGGFEESFATVNNIYEDQAFYAKACLYTSIMAVDRCWDKYRQHPQASTAVAMKTGQEVIARAYFLQWLENYLNNEGVEDEAVWHALRREQWQLGQLAGANGGRLAVRGVRWIKKWLLRVEEHLLPPAVSRKLWSRLPE